MEDSILKFADQFAWEPEIKGVDVRLPRTRRSLTSTTKFVVCGLGGSHLAAGLLKINNPKLDLLIHRDYGLPRVPDYFLKDSLIIASSYSGNTIETIDALKVAHEAGLNVAVIASGGTLLKLAQDYGLPYIQLPISNTQYPIAPRLALGYSIKAMAKLMGDERTSTDLSKLCDFLHPAEWREAGKSLADKIGDRAPIIYSSTVNLPLAYFWKISFNETGKVPAFYNVLPELNHNELESFSSQASPERSVGTNFHFIFLHDEADDHRIHQRMEITADLYADRGLKVEVIRLGGLSAKGGPASGWEKIFNSVLLAAWTSYFVALNHHRDPLAVPLIEEFKKLME